VLYDVTKEPYRAKGDGVTDDTDAIQRAFDDSTRGLDRNWIPVDRQASVLATNDRPTGGRIYFPSGGAIRERAYATYRVTKPLRVWGMTEVLGDGPMTMIDGREIPRDRALFEHHPVEIEKGGWWHSGNYYHDFALMSGGHAFATQPEHKTVGTLTSRWERLQICCRGYGIWFPHPAYCQEVWIDGVSHMNPCSGGVCLAGNLNFIRRYAMLRGYGGWDAKQGFRSPWLDGRGQIDIAGHMNQVVGCHVEHGLPARNGRVPPEHEVVPFRFWSSDPTWQQWMTVESNWPEFQTPGSMVDDCQYIFDRVVPSGTWAVPGVKCRYVDAGVIRVPYFNETLLGTFADVRGSTRVEYGYVRGKFAVDLPRNTTVGRVYMSGGYEGIGGKEYDPNPRGPEIPYKVEPYADAGSKVNTTVEPSGDIRIEVVTNGRTDGRACGGAVLTPADAVDREWVLYTAEQDGACMMSWWPNDPRPIGPDALCRTTRGRTAVPLLRWRPGSRLVLGATAVGVAWYRGVKIHPLEG
jgi:hypothetical protein